VTSDSYSESQYGIRWQNALMDLYGTDHWCLLADADEWLVYPGYERKSLAELAAYLDQTGAQGMFCFLVDMYGPDGGGQFPLGPSQSLLEISPYFDREYRLYRRFYIPKIQKPPFPELNVAGGPRLRLWYPRLRHHYYLARAFWRSCALLKLPIPKHVLPPPALIKIPFVRWLPGTRFLTSHVTTPMTLSKVTGALLHFKFLEDFYVRTVIEVKRKEHVYGGQEYARLLGKLGKEKSANFYYDGSVHYEDSSQLVRLGLLREDDGWATIRAKSEPAI
jgi:hypothetical protein